MVGLFWADADGCWLGAPPGAGGSAVRLTDDGLLAVGEARDAWRWSQVSEVSVPDAPSRSHLRRRMRKAADLAATMSGFGGPETAPRMTVRVTHAEGASEWPVSSAAAAAYTHREVELSHQLLEAFASGALRPSLITDWWRTADAAANLRSHARETLLEEWAGRA